MTAKKVFFSLNLTVVKHFVPAQKPAQKPATIDWIIFFNRFCVLQLDKLGTSEYTEFRFDIEVTSASLAVRESRDYFATCPVDIHYTRNAREGDEDDADQVYQQKSTSAEARFLVTS